MFSNEKNIFLIDGIGAFLSFIFTGLLLPVFSVSVGIPIFILHNLAFLPLAYTAYSFCCYTMTKKIKPWMLLTLICANIFYCILSGAIIFALDSLTGWGQFLLIAEILAVLAVVMIELNVYLRITKLKQ